MVNSRVWAVKQKWLKKSRIITESNEKEDIDDGVGICRFTFWEENV